MRILVFGRSGQLASALVQLRSAGCDIASLGRPDVDIASEPSVTEAITRVRPDVVVNAAAYTAVDKAEAERAAAFRINAEGAACVARATAAAGIPVMHVSTDYVFDGAKSAPYVERDAVAPLNVYGESKLAGEREVAAHNPRHVIVRTAWIVSPYGNNFCKTMLRLAAERDELRIVADQVGSPTYAPDLADGLVDIARQIAHLSAGDNRFGPLHLANAGATSWAELARATVAESTRHGRRLVPVQDISTADYPTPARRPRNSRLDCSRADQVFGVRLRPWRSAIADCVTALCAGPAA